MYAASTYTFLPQCTSCLVLYYGGKMLSEPHPEIQNGDLVSFVFYMQARLRLRLEGGEWTQL